MLFTGSFLDGCVKKNKGGEVEPAATVLPKAPTTLCQSVNTGPTNKGTVFFVCFQCNAKPRRQEEPR